MWSDCSLPCRSALCGHIQTMWEWRNVHRLEMHVSAQLWFCNMLFSFSSLNLQSSCQDPETRRLRGNPFSLLRDWRLLLLFGSKWSHCVRRCCSCRSRRKGLECSQKLSNCYHLFLFQFFSLAKAFFLRCLEWTCCVALSCSVWEHEWVARQNEQ